MPVKRNAGKHISPRPLLLDRARKVRPVPVRRAPLYKRAAKPTLVLGVMLAVGGMVAYRSWSGIDPARVIQAAPWLKDYLPVPEAPPAASPRSPGGSAAPAATESGSLAGSSVPAGGSGVPRLEPVPDLSTPGSVGRGAVALPPRRELTSPEVLLTPTGFEPRSGLPSTLPTEADWR